MFAIKTRELSRTPDSHLTVLHRTLTYPEGRSHGVQPQKAPPPWSSSCLCRCNDIMALTFSVAVVCPPRARYLKWIWVTVGTSPPNLPSTPRPPSIRPSARQNLEAFDSLWLEPPALRAADLCGFRFPPKRLTLTRVCLFWPDLGRRRRCR